MTTQDKIREVLEDFIHRYIYANEIKKNNYEVGQVFSQTLTAITKIIEEEKEEIYCKCESNKGNFTNWSLREEIRCCMTCGKPIKTKMKIEVNLKKFVEENDLVRKFRYSRLEHYVDKDDTWDRRKYENDTQFRAEIDTKVAYEVAMFNPILDFIDTHISEWAKVKEE